VLRKLIAFGALSVPLAASVMAIVPQGAWVSPARGQPEAAACASFPRELRLSGDCFFETAPAAVLPGAEERSQKEKKR